MDEEPGTPADVEVLPVEARAAAYLRVEALLEQRLELPVA